MAITPGTRFGPYEILSAIGAGGMGEVYRARDTKLGREVAIKVLPSSLTSDPDRLARFTREAQVLASLNHPNIAAIYGLEGRDGREGQDAPPAIVMELVEGETLADRIARGPIPLDEALPIARQIAEGLEAAHEQGIIHRDLKPANVKVTPAGIVKVLDFGLAKLAESAGSGQQAAGSAHLSMSPTITSPAMMTGVGVLLGTAAYMAPEQAKGRPADKRSDIWAFGCVLFEMLAGRRAFEGEDATDVIAAIIRGEPDWAALPTDVPASIRALMRRCLEKDRKRRVADIAVVQYLLDEPIAAAAGTMAPVPPSRRRMRAWLVAAAVLVLTVTATTAATWYAMRPAAPRVSRFEIVPSPDQPLSLPGGVNVIISPDGSTIVYHAQPGGVQQLLVRHIDQFDAKPLPGTERAANPFFSPDGSRVGFVVGSQLETVSIGGGPPTLVCAVTGQLMGASWQGDTIVFAQASAGLFRVPAAGGRPESIARPDAKKGETDYRWPELLPGGRAILYTVYAAGGARDARIVARRLDTGEVKTLVEGANDPHYVPTGHLLYSIGPSTLMAAPFDVGRLEIRGAKVPVLNPVSAKADGATNVALSEGGTLVYVRGASSVFQTALGFQWFTRDGKAAGAVASQIEGPRYPRLSPDGRSLAVTIGPANQGNIWVIDLAGTSQARELTFKAHNLDPVWSPDGRTIVFESDRVGQRNLFRIAADGSELEPTRLTTASTGQTPSAWSPDGQWILYQEADPKTKTDLMLLGTDGKTRAWLQTDFDEGDATFSPDGRWVSYVSDQTGRAEVWVRPFPGPGAPIRVSPDGGREPVWARNGSELFYQNGRTLMVATVAARQPVLQFAQPTMLFEGGFVPFEANVSRTYDVASDGRFLMIKEEARPVPPSLAVVQNWFEELKRLAPEK